MTNGIVSSMRECFGSAKMAAHDTVELMKFDYSQKKKKFDRSGEGKVGTIVGIVIGLFVVATIVPTALSTLANATLTGVDPAVKTILTVLLPILAVIGIAMLFLKHE